jgi:3-oxoacyl-[acyl-carrier protein] reductase
MRSNRLQKWPLHHTKKETSQMAHIDLTGKVALVTGANNPMGIGAATARALAGAGAKVFITYLRVRAEREHPFAVAGQEDASHESLQQPSEPGWALYSFMRMKPPDEVLDAIRQESGEAAAWEADLANAENIPALFDRAESKFGPVDVLVNNACHAAAKDLIEELTAETVDRTFAVNTRAPLLLTAEYVRRYREHEKTWGRIVNVSTGPAQYFGSQITYGSSKAAVEAATRAIAKSVGPLGITVNTVAPGPIQTGYIWPELEQKLLSTTPMRRIGQPVDIANVILFLCSQQAGYLTGQVLRVTGGLDM